MAGAAMKNLFDLSGKVALVTGGSRGLGYEIAKGFAAHGADLVITSRKAEACEKVAREIESLGRRALPYACHVGQWSDLDGLVEAAYRHFGKIDILVNNAGITGGNAPLWELAPAVWRRVVEVDLIAPYLVCRAVVPHMIAAGYGRIVNVASIAGKDGNPNASHYSASKAGLIGLTKSLAKELATTGVLVNAITPAAAKTELFAQMKQQHIDYMLSKIPMNRFLEVEEVAAIAAWLASQDCSFSTGAVFDISGGRAVY
jgi:2-dehydro-3-deoxy-L-rhamnonate dehydrogenase (NAD+)